MINPTALFQALADDTRLQMLVLLRQHGELCVCDLVGVLDITQSKASRHLRYLYNAGVVKDRRETVWIHYRIAEDLNPAQLAIVDGIENLLGATKISDLDSRFVNWMQRKFRCGPVIDKIDDFSKLPERVG
jgi:ArsR family transcriptional regulator